MATLDELAAQYGGTTAPISEGFQESPSGIRVPWANLPPAKADEARLRAATHARKYIDDNTAVVSQGESLQRDLDNFAAHNKDNRTGEFYSGWLPQSLQGGAEQSMTQILSKRAPSMRVEGSGTTSDRDIAMYIKTLPNVQTKGTVNQRTTADFNSELTRSRAKLQFLNEYYNTYGHIEGANAIWARDMAKNFETPKVAPPAKASRNKTNAIFDEADRIIKGK